MTKRRYSEMEMIGALKQVLAVSLAGQIADVVVGVLLYLARGKVRFRHTAKGVVIKGCGVLSYVPAPILPRITLPQRPAHTGIALLTAHFY